MERPTPGNNQRLAAECARCGRGVSEVVVRFCEEHAADFDGGMYCMRCQPIVRSMARRPMATPDWPTVLAQYRAPTRLRTVARRAPFMVVASGENLRVMPGSSDGGRTLTRADFERDTPFVGRPGRDEANEGSRNSTYVEAILSDIRRRSSS